MILREIELNDFDRIFPVAPVVYASGRFNALNATKADRVVALAAFDGERPVAGQIFGLRDGIWRAPFSAPFSCITSCTSEVCDRFYALAAEHLDAPLRLVWPSATYPVDAPPAAATRLFDDANFHYPMHRFDDFESHLSRSGRYSHHRSQKHPFQFAKTDDAARAYRIIDENRRAMGYPLAMSLAQVVDTVGIVPADFFVMSLDGVDIAAAMLFRVTARIMQLIYWGDIPAARHTRPMNRLAWEIFRWYAINRPEIETIDIGPASSDGIINRGLADFKLSIGCVQTSRPTLQLKTEN